METLNIYYYQSELTASYKRSGLWKLLVSSLRGEVNICLLFLVAI